MTGKILGKMEVTRGFIQIPAVGKSELIGDTPLPCSTTVNGSPARLDARGRLWSDYLKGKFSVGDKVSLCKSEGGYQVSLEIDQQVMVPKKAESKKGIPMMGSNSSTNQNVSYRILEGDCLKFLNDGSVSNVDLTFFDPPYRQGKEYRFFDDNQPASKYWKWLQDILQKVYDVTVDGGAIYFMQREKNAERVLRVLRKTGWTFQNLIIWKKKTSAVPSVFRYAKQHQIIAFATKGNKPRVFNRIRIDLPPLPEHKYERENGVYVTDVWGDVRELTSGYYAGDEALRDKMGKRLHTQQTPVALLLRIILSSTMPGDIVLDPLAGTGPTLVVAHQLRRNSIGIEIDPYFVKIFESRLRSPRTADNIVKHYHYYRFTPNLDAIWPLKTVMSKQRRLL
jgi:site-specific DNA-methyltransferase (adenine-specific)